MEKLEIKRHLFKSKFLLKIKIQFLTKILLLYDIFVE